MLIQKLSGETENETRFSPPERILVAIDGSLPSIKALNYALVLARLTNAKVTVVNVSVIPSFVTSAAVTEELRKQNSLVSSQIFENALKVAEQSNLQSIRTRMIETNSSVVKAIIDASNEMKADLIVIGTKGTTEGMPRLMLGSVAAGVVSFANCPVLAVR
jgi:nucleotide-binding universal stress UspA family protein